MMRLGAKAPTVFVLARKAKHADAADHDTAQRR